MTTPVPKPEVKKIQLIKGSEAIMKNITSIATKGKALDTLIHVTACSILLHIHENREVSLANKLLNALPKSSRKNALIEWFCTFGEMEWNEKDKAVVFVKGKDTQQEQAETVPFFEFKPEAEYHPIDLPAMLRRLIKNASKRNEEIEEKRKSDPDYTAPDSIDAALLESLKALVPAA